MQFDLNFMRLTMHFTCSKVPHQVFFDTVIGSSVVAVSYFNDGKSALEVTG